MEQDNNLEQEIKDIYRAIQKREAFVKNLNEEMNKEGNNERRRYSHILFFLSAATITFSYLLIHIKKPPYEYFIAAAVIGVFIGYLLMLASISINFVNVKKEISSLLKDPLNMLFNGFYQTVANDSMFSQTLQQYSIRALVIVKNRLHQSVMVQHRLNILVGPLGKLGLLPSILALSITFFKQDYHQITISLSTGFFVLYAIAFRASVELPRLHFYAQMLDDEVSMRN